MADLGDDAAPHGPKHALSNRTFGLIFAGVFGFWALLSFVLGDGDLVQSLIVAGVISGAVALVIPAALGPFNRGWARISAMLSRIVTAVVMGAVFFVVLTPVAVVMRKFRKEDPLRLRPDPEAESFWIGSDRPTEGRSSMDQQY